MSLKSPAETANWAEGMATGLWYRISGDDPDLDLPPTPAGTRYLLDGDPSLNPALNPPLSPKERLRRVLGRRPLAPWSGRMGFPAITEAWNGAVMATRAGSAGSMILFGGGHNNYFGSDVHRFDLASRQWRRIDDGFIAGRPADYGEGANYPSSTYPDGSPLPPHTYNYVQYDPVGNDLLLFKGQTELGPHVQAVAIPHMFNLDSLSWRAGRKHRQANFNSGGWTTWDPRRRILWGHSGDDGGGCGLSWYRVDGTNSDNTCGQWGPLYPNKMRGRANHNVMAMEEREDFILVTDHTENTLYTLDPEAPHAPLQQVTEAGVRPALRPYAALEYSRNLDCFVYFAGRDSPGVFRVCLAGTTASKTIRVFENLCSDPQRRDPIREAAELSRFETNALQVFGRFRIIDYEDATLAILVRHVDTPVYAMKLPAGD